MKSNGIFQRPPRSGVWWINYRDSQGRRRRQRVGSRAAALRTYRQVQDDLRAGRFIGSRRGAGAGPSFAVLARERMVQREIRLAPASQRADRCRLAPLLESFGKLPASAVTAERIDAFLAQVVKTGRTRATANRFRSLLSSIFALAVRNGRLAANPCAKVPPFKESAPRVRFLSAGEESAIRSAIRELYPAQEPQFDLVLNTGMRRGEQLSLTRAGVDLNAGVITVHGKTGQRHIPLNSAARGAVERLLVSVEGLGSLCAGAPRGWFEKAVKQASVTNFRFHDCRHTFASRLVMAGVNLRAVQELLGHRTLTMSLRYEHLSPEHQRANVERLTIPPDGHPAGTANTTPSVAA
jgi:site-specific recombinase XerD